MSRSARHTVILLVVTLSGCLAAFGGWRFAKASAPVNGPIVLISVDSLRADHLPAYGYRGGHTPAIDGLAADGVVFERAYAHVPQTLPSHVSLLTGRLPFESGVRDVAGFTLPGSARTIAEMLRDRGYATGGVVSSYLLRKETGIGRGFTFFDADLPEPDEQAPDRWLMRDGVDSEQVAEHWLESVGTSRAFLFLHIAEPHAPHAAPERFASLQPYDGEIAYADESVGRLVRYLKSHQLYDRATIILVSDHGEGLGDHGEQGHGLLVGDEALHVPLIIKQPGGDNAKRRVASPVQHIDIVPTILDLAKAPGAAALRGRSLTPLLGGGTVAAAPIYAESLFGAYRFGWAPLTSVIDGPYQLVSDGAQDEVLDLSAPPSARHNLAGEKPELLASLRKALAAFVGPPASGPAPVTLADRERFEALGYVGMPGTAPPDGAARVPVAAGVAFVERYRAAVLEARTGSWKDALEAYRALAREQPLMADVWMHLGRMAAVHERHDVAIDAFRQVLRIEPGNVAGHLGAAASYLRTRKFDDTVEHAQAALDGGDSDDIEKAEAHELLARAALGRKDAGVARDEAVAAETADPKRPVKAFVEGRLALDAGQYADAVTSFEAALAAAASDGRAPLADLRVFAADALGKSGRTDEAEQLLSAELAAFPSNPRARSALQALYRSSGRAKDAAALAQH